VWRIIFELSGEDEMSTKTKSSVKKKVAKPKTKYVLGPDIDLDVEVVLDKRGRRITEARAQQIARQILREAGAGRPSLTGAKIVSPEVKARVPQGMKDKLDREAKKLGVTPSALIRQALEEYLYD
jgi:hypothetical protein